MVKYVKPLEDSGERESDAQKNSPWFIILFTYL